MNKIRVRLEALVSVLRAKGALLLKFLTNQSLTMALNVVYGLVCVRMLSTDEYAKFVVVNGILGTVLILMDANLTATLVPLVGERVQNKRLIADYVATLRRLSVMAYVPVAIGTAIAYPYLVHHRGWSRGTIAGMVVAILITTWFARLGSNYLPVILIAGDRNTWYKANLTVAFGTLVLLCLCGAFRWLGAFQAITINVIGYVYAGVLYYQRSQRLLGIRGTPDAEKRRAITRLALPNVPQSIFFALQGQLSLYLMTYFGRTKSVASIGALSRLGQLFAVFMVANTMLVEPYFAKLPREKLKKHFALALVIAGSLSVSIWSLASLFPDILLRVLGSQYGTMRHELRLAVGASAISFVSAMFWGVNSARRFVYWWNVGFNISLIFAVQVMFIWKGDLSSLVTALWLNIATNCASLFVNITASAWGFLKGPREAERRSEGVTQQQQEVLTALQVVEVEEQPGPVYPQPEIVEAATQD